MTAAARKGTAASWASVAQLEEQQQRRDEQVAVVRSSWGLDCELHSWLNRRLIPDLCVGMTCAVAHAFATLLVDSGTKPGLETHSGSGAKPVPRVRRRRGTELVETLSPVLPIGMT